jgi:hypothetical protein
MTRPSARLILAVAEESRQQMEQLFEDEPLRIPAEFLGEYKKSGGYTSTEPRTWTEQELSWCLEQKAKGYNNKQIAQAVGRSEVSVQIKFKRVSKTSDSYNDKNRDLKYEANAKFFDLVKPDSVLDVFAGNSHWQTLCANTVTNDKDTRFWTDYNMDSLDLLCQLKLAKTKFDLIDLDPYGSAYDCFDLAIKLSKKAVVVSFGEWGHKRWKRFDFVQPRYGIGNLEDFGEGEKFVTEFQRIAAVNKKLAEPVQSIQYSNFLRVYFRLTELKITSQWDDNK